MVAATRTTKHYTELERQFWRRALSREVQLFARAARGRRIRSRLQFARDCIVLPEGPFKDEHWRPEYQPFCASALQLMDDCGKRKFRFTGCVQSGKSFIGVIVVLWHLLERGEDVGYAVPDLDQSARDKWHKEFLPVIEASPVLRRLLPESGEGSQGGTPTMIKFGNSATLRFISGTGSDKNRSNFTVHVVFKTEVDRYDTAGEVSRETSPPEQIENRTEAYGDLGWSYEECTVTDEQGRIWTELQESTNHKFHVRCVHCQGAVCPGREDLHGVEDCQDVEEAEAKGRFHCPACDSPWSERERRSMLSDLLPVGEGQSPAIGTDGAALIEGDLRPTKKCGFSWNAFHNQFWSTAKIAADEWTALYSRNPTDMDLKRRQHAWTLPSEADVFVVTPLSVRDIIDRSAPRDAPDNDWRRTIPLRYAPPGTLAITAGVDVGKRWLHFVVRAFYQTQAGINHRVIDLGELPVRTDEIGFKRALPEAMLQLDDRFSMGYGVWGDDEAGRLPVNLRGVDGGWQGDELGSGKERHVWATLLQFVTDGRGGWIIILGRGQSEPPGKGSYSHPKKLGGRNDKNGVLWIGDQCHIRRSAEFAGAFAQAGAENPASYCIANSDHFKEQLRTSYADTPIGEDGAALSFNALTKADRELLRKYGKQVTAESRISRHVLGRGRVNVFENESNRPNHLGDADYYSLVMATVLELPLDAVPMPSAPPKPTREPSPVRTPGNQKYLATQR